MKHIRLASRIAASIAVMTLFAGPRVTHAGTSAHTSPTSPTSLGSATSVKRDSAETLYRNAREALNDGDYARAAAMFRDFARRFPESSLLPDAMYYQAFALYRDGTGDDLVQARAVLRELRSRFQDFAHHSDAAALSTRVCGVLARQGDAACAAEIASTASEAAVIAAGAGPVTGANAAAIAAGRAARGSGTGRLAASDSGCGGDADTRVAALNALLQMDADEAVPILEKVIARRDACSVSLRRQAMFLISQKQSPRTLDVMLNAARTDPDASVRQQAVFWLSQAHDPRAVTALSEMARTSSDDALRERAVFALGQMHTNEARQLLRGYASDASVPASLRERAVFWLGQNPDPGNIEYLESLYTKLPAGSLKERVLFSISQSQDPGAAAWLLDVAARPGDDVESRKKAIFYAGQSNVPIDRLARLYDSLHDTELRKQVIFTLSQRREAAATDKLIAIARSDTDREARRQAIFWLGQSHDPRAVSFLASLVNQ